MTNSRTRVLVLVTLVALTIAFASSASVAMATKWNGHFTAGGSGTTFLSPDQAEFIPPVGTRVTFSVEVKADNLEEGITPGGPVLFARVDAGATIKVHGTWIDHSFSPPRVFRLQAPLGFFCRSGGTDSTVNGIGTDSYKPGIPVMIVLSADGAPDAMGIWAIHPIPPLTAPLPDRYYAADAKVTSGKLVQRSCQ